MTSTKTKLIDWETIVSELSGMEVITNSIRVAKLSLDYYHFSPVLRSQLRDKRGDLVVSPVSEAEVLRVAQVCVKYQVPLTVRGQEQEIMGSASP